MSSSALKALQEELAALKASLGAKVKITKASGKVVVSFLVEPPDKRNYDAGTISIQVTLDKGAADDCLSLEERVQHVLIELPASSELPSELCSEVAHVLQCRWKDVVQNGSGRSLCLQFVYEEAQSSFVALVSSKPELLEAYEGTDANGATVRRFALLSAVVAPQDAPQSAPAAGSAVAAPPEAAESTEGSTSQPSLLTREAEWLRRRFGAALCIDEANTPRGGLAFTLALRPNDPDWVAGRELHLQGSAAPEYPARGSFQLVPGPGLPDQEAQLLARLLEGEAQRLAGRPDALRCLVRYADTRAAQLLHTVDDVLVEAARRRAAHATAPDAAAATSAPAGAGASPQAAAAPPAAPGSTTPAGAAPAASAPAAEPVLGAGLWWPQRALGAGAKPGFGRGWPAEAAGPGSAMRGPVLSASAGPSRDASSRSSSAYTSSEESDWDSSAEGSSSVCSLENGGAAGMASTRQAPSGLDVRLEGLKLDNLDALEPARLVVQVACSRCQRGSDMSLEMEAVSAGTLARDGTVHSAAECSGCHQALALALVPRHVHERSAVVGVLTQVLGCAPMDLLPSLFVGQCGSCCAAAALRAVQVGRPTERDCSRCHSRMGVSFQAVSFQPRARPAAPRASRKGPSGGGEPRPASAAHAAVVQEGQPLPNLGTCAHYRHSHRWLRFPCCGQRFPCDLCHEEGTDGHEMKWAQRMTCGYCAKEQPLGEHCIACGKRLARSTAGAGGGSRFWEGGEGCRDRTRMNRNDPHKYRNSKYKTQSKKTSRVGAEGKKRLQRGQKKAQP